MVEQNQSMPKGLSFVLKAWGQSMETLCDLTSALWKRIFKLDFLNQHYLISSLSVSATQWGEGQWGRVRWGRCPPCRGEGETSWCEMSRSPAGGYVAIVSAAFFCLFSWLKNPLLSYLNFMARSSPGTRLLPWHLTPCQHMYPLKPSLTVCVYVCMWVWVLSLKYSQWPKYSVCVFTETIRRLFEQAAEDGHVPQISPHCE